MNQETKRSYGTIWKRRLKMLPRAFRVLIIFIVAVVVVYLVLDQVMWRRVVAQREVFLEKFGGVDFEDFRPERPPPEEDAGRVYNYASALVAKANALYGGWDPRSLLVDPENHVEYLGLDHTPTRDEIVEVVREKLLTMQEPLDLIREAVSLNQGSMIDSYDPESLLPALAQARVLARKIAAQAQLAAIDGNSEEAFEWVTAGLHFANSFSSEPQLICQLVRLALTGLALSAAEEILNESGDSPTVSDSFRRELDIARRQEDYIRALAGEFAWSRMGSESSQSLRLMNSLVELEMNHFLFDLSNAMRIDSLAERRRSLSEVAANSESYGHTPFSVVSMLTGAVVRSGELYDRCVVQCDQLELALALRSYKKEQGAYPDRLSSLSPAYIDSLPEDLFSGGAYVYRIQGDGFVLYSVGINLKDDGGIERKRRQDGDIVWEVRL